MSDEGDPFFFEHVLNSVPLVSLLDAARELDGVEFFHGTRQQMTRFSFLKGEPALRACLEWAAVFGLEDVRKALGEQQLAAIRAWTCTPLCYILCFLLRSPSRSRASVKPVLPYARLMFEGLHALPERYIFQDGTLYRAETGAMTTWDSKMYPGGSFGFYAPTSFSRDPAVLKNFKEGEMRTVFILHGASGWILDDFSRYKKEQEVLVEPVCFVDVIAAEKFDASHRDVLMGEIKQGLHRVQGRVRPGVELLEGSQVKKYETESYRKWQEEQQRKLDGKAEVMTGLEFDPFTDEEWVAKGKMVPKKDKERKMSLLGKGAFMSTFRKKGKLSAISKDVRRFAVKVVERENMESLGITEKDVRQEARTLGLMRHKHVTRYYGWEESDEEFGIVMEIAQGGSLRDLIKKRATGIPVETGELLEIMLQMSSAMEYIHMQGIVHRDIKADNILLAHPEGDGPLCIKVADFGVAAVLSTVAGSAALLSNRGTEVYYAPERGNQQAYGAKADMWALGMMLTELVTLSQINKGLWHSGSEVSERRGKVLQQVATKDEALGKLAKDLLHMDKDCRLGAPALHTELRVLVRSRKADASPACGTPAAPSRDNGIFNLADLAAKLVKPEAVHDVLAEVHILSQQRAGDPDALRDLQQLHHWLGRHMPVLKNPPVHMLKTVVQLASQEPAGSRLLQEAEAALQKAQTLQQEVIEWANKPAAPLPCMMEIREHSESVYAVAVSHDGKWIASGSGDTTVKVVMVETGRVVHTLEGHSKDNKDCTCKFDICGNFEKANPACPVQGHSGPVYCVSFDPSNPTLLVSGSGDKTIRLWDVGTGKELKKLEGHSDWVRCVQFSPKGDTIVSGSQDRTLKIWDVALGTCKATLKGHSARINNVRFSLDGTMLASCSGHYAYNDNSVRLWNVGTGEQLKKLEGHSCGVNCVSFDPSNPTLLVSGSYDETILWDVDSGKELKKLEGHSNTVDFSFDGKVLASGREDGMIILWDPKKGERLKTLEGHSRGVNCVSFNPANPTLLVSGSGDKTIRLWDVGTGKELKKLEGHSRGVRYKDIGNLVFAVDFSFDGKVLASGGRDNNIILWDPKKGERLKTLEGHSGWVMSVAWRLDGKLLASGSFDKTVKIWNPSAGECLKTLEGHRSHVYVVSFSADGSLVASCSGDYSGKDFSVRMWSVETGQELKKFLGHSDWVFCVQFSPKGDTIVSGSEDRTIKIWDVASGTCKATLKGHRYAAKKVEFSQDGATLVSSHDNETISWDVATGARKDKVAGQLAFTKTEIGRYIVTHQDDLIFVYDTRGVVVNADGKEKVPIAFFRAPSLVLSVCCAGDKVAVGCQSGAVLTLHAAWLT